MPATATASRSVNDLGAKASARDGRPALSVMDSFRTMLATTAKMVRTRLEIISTEIEEQREWLQSLLLLAVAGLFFLSMGFLLVTLFVVALFWESHPVAVLGGFSALYLGVGIWAALTFRAKLRERPKMFAATTGELAKDEAQLNTAR
jgi:uncharacterized membrane protein YqjE